MGIKDWMVIDANTYTIFNPGEKISVSEKMEELPDSQRVILTPILREYAMENKKWLEFFVDSVTGITWNTKAFESLSKNKDTFDGVVRGKEHWVIMLLGDPPWAGKSLAAEGPRKLASKVESTLKDVLSIVPRWGAVLLLDEAGVFIEARNSTDLAKNELFLEDAGLQRFSDEGLDELVKLELNGRKIKNVLRTAHLMASEADTGVTYEDVRTIVDLNGVSLRPN
ncbi:P-loop containing nucleoside triphosphate hydrolase protein [Penicillium argentinense]|uniref:P-loop containing nucleoside triphosphate hydrolase protein n=1 Tax=Penicillium argentinense TaxID=1131581 RepID=A0A9W9KLR7_9EURO|nr:P-loop containing nucleoside triphosphate hydrolase protein [Penicillium argentinense]KAJ5110042.1 P-loop containing nucleoside triphosphate hydrolase protein [Penicillium argentinense]